MLKTSIEYAQGKSLSSLMFRDHAPPAKNIYIAPIESISTPDQSDISVQPSKPLFNQ